MTLPELAIRRPVTAMVLLISMFVIGGIALQRLPLGFMPDEQEINIFVIVDYPNASPSTVERQIIRPLEEVLSPMNGIQNIWSRCDQNGGRVNLTFDYATDMGLARAEIRDRIDRVRDELPDDVERIRISTDWNPRVSGETILEARLSSGRDLSKDYDLLERKIIKPLERIPGVASVSLDGVNPREVKVNLDLSALKRHRVDIREVARILRSNNIDRSLGVLRDDTSRFSVRVSGAYRRVEEVKKLPIPGTTLKIQDVAEVTYEEPPLIYGRNLDLEFAVGVSVTKESSANTVEVTRMVRERVAGMTDDPELKGINFLVWQDQGKEITKTIADLQQTGWIGAILASVILFLFLRRMSATVIAILCIPFSLIVACGVIWAQGKTLNTITLLGLIVGVGMLVDNAVVIMENINRFQNKGLKPRVAALLGAREVSVAVMAATLTSVIVFLPMIFSEPSEMNLLLRELGMTICITLLASLLVSQTLIPLASTWMRPRKKRAEGRIMKFLSDIYVRAMRFTLDHRWLGPLVGLLIIGSVIYPFQKIEKNFATNPSEMFVGIRYVFSEEPSLEVKKEYVDQVEALLMPLKDEFEVNSVYSYWSENFTTTRLYMREGFTHEEHMADIRQMLPEVLPALAGVRLQIMDNARPWQRNRGKRIGIQLRGPDSEVLAQYADQGRELLRQIPGLYDYYSSSEGGTAELHTQVDRDRARAYGVDLRQPSDVVELTFRGRRMPRFKGADGEVEMRLTLDDREVHSIDQLHNLPLLRSEDSIALNRLADFAIVKGPDQITRNNRVTNVWIGGRYREGKRDDYLQQAQELLSDMELPYGYSWNFRVNRQDQENSQREFIINLLLALGLIFAVMAGLFESIQQAISLTISLPFALVGAFWALYLAGVDFDQPASVGLMLLLGIVVNNGIVMIEHINAYRRAGMERRAAMLRGGRERLRPILMTALTTLGGLVPMVIQKPSLGGVYYYSMAYVVIGGLLLSTVLTAMLLPVTITLVEDFFSWIGARFAPRKRRWFRAKQIPTPS